MRRLFVLLMAFCIVLCACMMPPEETSDTLKNTDPTASGAASGTNDGPTVPTTMPMESTAPTESTLPEETAQPLEDPGYTIRIEDPEKAIYENPGFRYPVAALFGEVGTYTIVEEAYDWDGNLWGRLKSGIGWVCLTDPVMIPIWADYAPAHFKAAQSWHCGETAYVTDIGILPNEHLKDISFTLLTYTEKLEVDQVLYTLDTLEADEAVKLSVVFWGDMTTYGMSFTDSQGNQRYFALSVSGKDGSLIYSEYIPD